MKSIGVLIITVLLLPLVSAGWSFSSKGIIGGPTAISFNSGSDSVYYSTGATQRSLSIRGKGYSANFYQERPLIVKQNYDFDNNRNYRSIDFGGWQTQRVRVSSESFNANVRNRGGYASGFVSFGRSYLGVGRHKASYSQYGGWNNYNTPSSAYIR